MRGSKEQKAATRHLILAAAGQLFRQYGVDAVGVDAIMHAAGLTHGGFYGHFPSKEALVAEVAAGSLAHSAARWQRISTEYPPQEAWQRIVGTYLDPAHLADTEHGCVLTTLGPDMARRPKARPRIADALSEMTAALQRCRPLADEEPALATLATMVGAVVLARLAETPDEAEAILAAARILLRVTTRSG